MALFILYLCNPHAALIKPKNNDIKNIKMREGNQQIMEQILELGVNDGFEGVGVILGHLV